MYLDKTMDANGHIYLIKIIIGEENMLNNEKQ